MKLSAPQERMLIELAEPNHNDENEWRVGGPGQLRTCQSLERLGLSTTTGSSRSRRQASAVRARLLVEQLPDTLPAGTRWHDGKHWRSMGGSARREGLVYVWNEPIDPGAPAITEKWEAPLIDIEMAGLIQATKETQRIGH